MLAGRLRRNSAGWRKRIVHFADHGNKRRILGHQRHDRLGLNRPVLNAVDDLLLDLARGTTGRPDGPSVWDCNIALGIDRLVGKSDEVARPHTCFAWDEQTTRSGLKD